MNSNFLQISIEKIGMCDGVVVTVRYAERSLDVYVMDCVESTFNLIPPTPINLDK